ncbi:hypothetical protein JTB14_031425 [Gonioctena quinquepunctata]|nr:hypothetical protein JTB14_031425 [Gonioctena quinquepunctata]
MKNLLILAVISAATANPVNDITSEYLSTRQSGETYVKTYLYTRTDPDGIQVSLSDRTSVSNSSFDATKNTVFVTHGWTNNYLSPSCVTVREAFLKAADANVFVIDWSDVASLSYQKAQKQMVTVGKIVGDLVKSFSSNNNFALANISMVGHSLGAHLVGVAGKELGGELNNIVGLDPALPWFSVEETSNRLNKGDAQFVQIIHTCSGVFGFAEAIGDSDYWPNGGRTQPGCESDNTGACNHGRSFQLYAESLISGNFFAQKCDSYAEYNSGNCAGSTSYLGGYHLDTTASGSYFLNTNSDEPYAKGTL